MGMCEFASISDCPYECAITKESKDVCGTETECETAAKKSVIAGSIIGACCLGFCIYMCVIACKARQNHEKHYDVDEALIQPDYSNPEAQFVNKDAQQLAYQQPAHS